MGMGVAVVMVEKRPSGAEKEPRRGDLSPDRGGRGRAAASIQIRNMFDNLCSHASCFLALVHIVEV